VIVAGHTVRRATSVDAPAIQALFALDPDYWLHAEGAPLRANEAVAILEERPPNTPDDKKHVFLVDEDAALLDFCEGYPTPTTWFLGLIFLAPRVRNRGLGTHLLEALFAHVRAHGGTALRLAVATQHPEARRLYDRLGFQFVEHRNRTIHTGDVIELALMERAL
jgi:ribosomal protein S18 acetylase RimI-like enzyme